MTNKAAHRQAQIKTFLANNDFADAELLPLAGDASFRRYIRIQKADAHAMLMDAPADKEDVRPYLKIAKALYAHGYSVPNILGSDPVSGLLLLEDLGDDSFTSVLKAAEKHRVSELDLYAPAIDLLAEWYQRKDTVANLKHLPLPVYDTATLMREVGLFSDWYLPQVMGKADAAACRDEYENIWQDILVKAPLANDCLVHRDYHADNLMWLPSRRGVKRVGLLDFQDAVYGDAAYDLVSLLEDARRDVAEATSQQMIQRFIESSGVQREQFLAAYALLGAQRNSKIIGIFVRLAARDGKYAYLNFLPRVWGHLERDLAHPVLAPLKKWMDKHVAPQWRGVVTVRHTSEELAIGA